MAAGSTRSLSIVQGTGGVAVVTRDDSLYMGLASLIHSTVERFTDVSQLPLDRHYAVYIVDEAGGETLGRVGETRWPAVELAGQPPSRFVFLATTARTLAVLGALPPRSFVLERDAAVLPRLRDLLESPTRDEDRAHRFSEAIFVDSRQAVFFRFAGGRSYVVGVEELGGTDPTPVTELSIVSDGYAVLVRQRSGNEFVVPWDIVLYLAEPEYPFHRPGHGVVDLSAEGLTSVAPTGLGGVLAEPDDGGRAVAIGRRIRLERTRRRWTLADLSALTGMKVPNLSRLENGRHVPSLETLERVAGALNVPVAVLVTARSG